VASTAAKAPFEPKQAYEETKGMVKGLVDPAAKLAAAMTVSGESPQADKFAQETYKESMEHPEGVLMPGLVALGAGKAGSKLVAGRAKAPVAPRGEAVKPAPAPNIMESRFKAKFPAEEQKFWQSEKPKDVGTKSEKLPESVLEPMEKPPVSRATPKAKEAWEMTKAEFVETEMANRLPEKTTALTLGSRADLEGSMWLKLAHEHSVYRAASEGKPIPPEVLADYPDLAAKYGKVEAAKTAEVKAQPSVSKPTVSPPTIKTPKAPEATIPGETAEATLAIRTEAEAIAKKLTDDFGELPEYKTMNMRQQAEAAQKVITKDYEQAKRMAMGEEPPPTGLREASIYEAVKIRALKEGDVETLLSLATESKIPTKLSEYGQAIKAADSEIMSDPVRVMQDISKVRAERAERTGKKYSANEVARLRKELETLQKALSERVTKKTPRKYGASNKIVNQAAYEQAKAAVTKSLSTLSANPMANPALVANMAKIGTYHLEAGTRVFADWSARMVADLGEKVRPHLKDLWKQVNDNKKLRTALKTQKTRLAHETEKYTGKLESFDLTKEERRILKLDPEAKKLKRQRDIAKKNYDAAVNASKAVTKEEAQNIVELSKLTEDARIKMEKGGDRLEYGAAQVTYENYVNALKGENASIKTILRERGQQFKKEWGEFPPKAVLNISKDAIKTITDNSVALVASIDNSFPGRQGLKTLMTHPSKWWKATSKSFSDIYKELGGKASHDALMADIYSREKYINGEYQKSGIFTKIEEQFPGSSPGRVPVLGRAFNASEAAFIGNAIRMRTGLYDLLSKRARGNGVKMTDVQIKDIGTLINGMTARGRWGVRGEPAFIRLFMWAPKMLKGNWDFLTAHNLGTGLKTSFARKEAAKNILKVVAETASLMLIANSLKPGSAEYNPLGTDFGKVKIGDTRFDITGGAGSIVVLASRIATGKRKTQSGTIVEYSGGWGAFSRLDALSNFLVNKTTPAMGVVMDWLRGSNYKGDPFSLGSSAWRSVTPITVQQTIELKDNASADRVAGAILDGIDISSYSIDKKQNNKNKSYSPDEDKKKSTKKKKENKSYSPPERKVSLAESIEEFLGLGGKQ